MMKSKRKMKRESRTNQFETIGGVYTIPLYHHDHDHEENSSDANNEPRDTNLEQELVWASSGSDDHHMDSPVFKKRSDFIDENELKLGDEEIYGHVMMRSRMSLPDHSGGFASFHVLINADRTKRGVAPLARNRALDELAREQAQEMAKSGNLMHTNPLLIQKAIGKPSSRLGENVARGTTIHQIHDYFKRSQSDLNNIMDRRFTVIGIGTSKGEDGKLYVCQIFRGGLG